MQTHELWNAILEAGGAKRVAQAIGRDLSTAYKWARHPMASDEPDGTGSSNIFDWFESVVEVLAARPSARPTLRLMRLWFDDLFRLAIDRDEAPGITDMSADSLVAAFWASVEAECTAQNVESEKKADFARTGNLSALATASRKEAAEEELLAMLADELERRKIDPRAWRNATQSKPALAR